MPRTYDLRKIRLLLHEGFTRQELRLLLCQGIPEFQPLHDQLPQAINKDELIEHIIVHAETISELDNLLKWAQKTNASKYSAYYPYYSSDVRDSTEWQLKALAKEMQQQASETNMASHTPTEAAALPVDTKQSRVTVGQVKGGIHDTVIAGRDVSRTKIGQVLINIFSYPEISLAQRNREAMLKQVYSFWIKGVLEKSLHGIAMLELGLVERADAVDNPLNIAWKTARSPDSAQDFPVGTKIINVFDQTEGALLILGEPGSGKTTMLLELARDTISRAESDPTQPIPVVFNLSSWAHIEESIGDWLVKELKAKYLVSEKIGRSWIKNRELLLLLDGLDEVKLEHREECVWAINKISQDYGLKNIVVCSRIADYETLAIRLRLQGAILLKPLTAQQVDSYLTQAGVELAAVRALVQEDAILKELLPYPLNLSIMTLAYKGQSVSELQGFDSIEKRRLHLFKTYVERMFHRAVRTNQTIYPREQTINWLAWLAKRMSQHNQSVFQIESIQPTWLETRAQLRPYIIVRRLIGVLFGGAIFGWMIALAFGVMRVSVGGFLGELITDLFTGLRDRLLVELVVWQLVGMLISLILGLFFRDSDERLLENIDPGKVLRWSWKKIRNELSDTWLKGFSVWLTVVLIVLFAKKGWAIALISGLISGLSTVLFFLLTEGMSEDEIETRTFPNQGTWYAARSGVIGGLAWGLVWGVVSGLISGLFRGPIFGFNVGVFFGMSVGFFLGLGYGLNFILHFILRFILYRNGYIPWNYARFLDYATERIFLRKIGGDYIFIHRLLMEYFASLDRGQYVQF